ncbi:hypothetical protein D9M68_878500 [compost metagenome]
MIEPLHYFARFGNILTNNARFFVEVIRNLRERQEDIILSQKIRLCLSCIRPPPGISRAAFNDAAHFLNTNNSREFRLNILVILLSFHKHTRVT